MMLSSNFIGKLFDLANKEKHIIQLVSGYNTGQIKYYISQAPSDFSGFMKINPNMVKDASLLFHKAVPYVPNFYDLPMSFDSDRLPSNYRSAKITDYSQYGPGKITKIIDDLVLNTDEDFINRHSPVPLDRYNLYRPNCPQAYRPLINVCGVGVDPIGTSIDFDHFIDGRLVNQYEFKPENHPSKYTYYPENPLGFVIFTDPRIKRPIKSAIVQYYSPFGDTKFRNRSHGTVEYNTAEPIDYYLNLLGINSMKGNQFLRKLAAFELAKGLEQEEGIPCNMIDGKLTVMMPSQVYANKTTSGIFDSWVKKLTRQVKKLGKKIEKSFTTPLRNQLKEKMPAVWASIDKLDKSIGFERTMKKFGTQLDGIAEKYGSKLMEAAVNAAASRAGAYVGMDPDTVKTITNVTVKTADFLTNKDKDKLAKLIDNVDSDALMRGDITSITNDIMGSIKGKMIDEKGGEGLTDYNNLVNLLGEMKQDFIKEGTKTIEKLKTNNRS